MTAYLCTPTYQVCEHYHHYQKPVASRYQIKPMRAKSVMWSLKETKYATQANANSDYF